MPSVLTPKMKVRGPTAELCAIQPHSGTSRRCIAEFHERGVNLSRLIATLEHDITRSDTKL
jgi:hypothetical protein